MSRGPLIFLVLFVGLLSFLVLQQKEIEDGTRFHRQELLLGEMDPSQIVGVFVDHTDRETYLGFELTERGWMLTDPLRYPVQPALFGALLKGLQQNARFVAVSEEEDLEASFEPPRASLRILARDGAGEPQELEIVLGALDVDGMSQYARTRGGTFRILRTLDTVLQRSVKDFRSKQLLSMNPEAVVRVERRWQGPEQMDPDFSFLAERKGGGWQLLAPERVKMDPFGMLLWLKALRGVEVQGFAYDPPADPSVASFDIPLARWGLDNPEMVFEWQTSSGLKETLLMSGGREGGSWSVVRPGEERILGVGGKTADSLIQHWIEFTDRALLHTFRPDVQAIRLLQGARTVRLYRTRGDVFGLQQIDELGQTQELGLASPVLVDGIFGALENGLIEAWERDLKVTEEFPTGGERWGYALELGGIHGDEVQVAWIGRELFHEGEDLTRTFMRPGESMVGRVDATLFDVISRPADDFRSLEIWSLDEVDLVRLDVRWNDLTRSYMRQHQGTWRREGQERSATELLDLLDMLFFLSAESYLQGQAEPLDKSLEVSLTRRDGELRRFTVGLRPGAGSVLVTDQGVRAVPAKSGLHGALLALFKD